MNSRIIVVFALLVLSIWCAPLHASDVWVLRNHESVSIAGSCSALETRDELLLQNSKAADASVVVRGISNGTEVDAGAVVTVPGGRTMTIDYARPMWFTHDPAAKWWAVHLDVPEAVVIASALDLGTANCSVPQPPTFAPNRIASLPCSCRSERRSTASHRRRGNAGRDRRCDRLQRR